MTNITPPGGSDEENQVRNVRRDLNGTDARILQLLKDYGATRITSAVEGKFDFHTPMPGDQPIPSGIVAENGAITKATIRFGVLDENLYGNNHPTGDDDEIRRLVRLFRSFNPPPGPLWVSNYGDARRVPRPHLLMGWKSTIQRQSMIVRNGFTDRGIDVNTFFDYLENVTPAVREEFQQEWVENNG